jgi:hypothetical protein
MPSWLLVLRRHAPSGLLQLQELRQLLISPWHLRNSKHARALCIRVSERHTAFAEQADYASEPMRHRVSAVRMLVARPV